MVRIVGGCPGQNTAYLKDFNTNIISCSKCGNEVEFFSDEKKVKCPRCHNNVFKVNPQIIEYKDDVIIFHDSGASCLDWCGMCMDKKDYQDILKNNERIEEKKEDIKKLINSIDKRDEEVIGFFIEAFQKSINNAKLIDQNIFEILQRKNPDLFIRARNYYLSFLDTK